VVADELAYSAALKPTDVSLPEEDVLKAMGFKDPLSEKAQSFAKSWKAGEVNPQAFMYGQPSPGSQVFQGSVNVLHPEVAKERGVEFEAGNRLVANPQLTQAIGRDADGDYVYATPLGTAKEKNGKWEIVREDDVKPFQEQDVISQAEKAVSLGRGNLIRGDNKLFGERGLLTNPATIKEGGAMVEIGQEELASAMAKRKDVGGLIGGFYNRLEDVKLAAEKTGGRQASEDFMRMIHGRTQGFTVPPKGLMETMETLTTFTEKGGFINLLEGEEGTPGRALSRGLTGAQHRVFRNLANAGKDVASSETIAGLLAPQNQEEATEFIRQYRGAESFRDRQDLMREGMGGKGFSGVFGSAEEFVQESPFGMTLGARLAKRVQKKHGNLDALGLPQGVGEMLLQQSEEFSQYHDAMSKSPAKADVPGLVQRTRGLPEEYERYMPQRVNVQNIPDAAAETAAKFGRLRKAPAGSGQEPPSGGKPPGLASPAPSRPEDDGSSSVFGEAMKHAGFQTYGDIRREHTRIRRAKGTTGLQSIERKTRKALNYLHEHGGTEEDFQKYFKTMGKAGVGVVQNIQDRTYHHRYDAPIRSREERNLRGASSPGPQASQATSSSPGAPPQGGMQGMGFGGVQGPSVNAPGSPPPPEDPDEPVYLGGSGYTGGSGGGQPIRPQGGAASQAVPRVTVDFGKVSTAEVAEKGRILSENIGRWYSQAKPYLDQGTPLPQGLRSTASKLGSYKGTVKKAMSQWESPTKEQSNLLGSLKELEGVEAYEALGEYGKVSDEQLMKERLNKSAEALKTFQEQVKGSSGVVEKFGETFQEQVKQFKQGKFQPTSEWMSSAKALGKRAGAIVEGAEQYGGSLTRRQKRVVEKARGIDQSYQQLQKKMDMDKLAQGMASGQGGGGLVGKVAGGIKRLSIGWAPMQMRRAWSMTGGQVFDKYIPAAAQAEAAGWQTTQALGGYSPGVPSGVAGGVMQAKAMKQQAMINAGRTGYRAWGGLLGKTGGLGSKAMGIAGPGMGAGMMALVGGAALGLPMGPVGMLAGGLAAGGAVLGSGLATASYGTASPDNYLAAAEGSGRMPGFETTGAFRSGLGNLLRGGLTEGLRGSFKEGGLQGLSNRLAENLQAGADFGTGSRVEGERLRGTALGDMGGQEQMAAINKIAQQLHKDKTSIWSTMDEGQVLQQMGKFMPYAEEIQGMSIEDFASEGAPSWMTKAVSRGISPDQYAGLSKTLGLGLEGTRELTELASTVSAPERTRWQNRMGKLTWMRQYGVEGEEILDMAGDFAPEATPMTTGGTPTTPRYQAGQDISSEEMRRYQRVAQTLQSGQQILAAQGVQPQGLTRQQIMTTDLQTAVAQKRGAQMTANVSQKFGFAAQDMMQVMPQQLSAAQYRGVSQVVGGQGNLQQVQQFGQMTGMGLQSNLVTKGPAGMRIGTIAPVSYGLSNQQFTQQYAQAQERLQTAKQTGDFTGGWGSNTIWGIQDAITGENLRHQRVNIGLSREKLALREERLQEEEEGTGPNAMARQLRYVQALGGKSPVSDYQYTGRFPMMYQREAMNWGYQQQQFGFQQQRMGINRRWQNQQFQFQQEALGIRQSQFATQKQWQQEDWGYQTGRSAREFGWQMEDIEENIRFATGRQRQQLIKQKERSTIRYGEQRSRFQTQKERQEEQWSWKEQSFEREEQQLSARKQHAEELQELQQQQFDAQKAHAEEQHAFRLQQIEEQEQAFKDSWEIQEEKRKDDLEYQRKSLEIAKKKLDEAERHAEAMAGLQNKMRDVQRAQQVLVSDFEEAMIKALANIVKELDPVAGAAMMGSLPSVTGSDSKFRGAP